MTFTAFRIVKNIEDAKDIASDFIKDILSNAHNIDYVDNPVAWIAQSVRNNAIRIIQKSRRSIYLEEVSRELCITKYDFDFALELEKTLETLSERERNLFNLRYFMGYSFSEIEKELGESSSKLRKDMCRIKDKIKHLEELY